MNNIFLSSFSFVMTGVAKFFLSLGVSNSFLKEIIIASSVGKAELAMNEKDYFKAQQLLEKVVDYNLSCPYLGSAQYMYGLLYYHGLSVEKDLEKSSLYFNKAILNSNTQAKRYVKKQMSSGINQEVKEVKKLPDYP